MDPQDETNDELPTRESAEDFSGHVRSFVLNWLETPLGYSVRAYEEGQISSGYEFAAMSEVSPWAALHKLRKIMRTVLMTRYLTGSPGRRELTHGVAVGTIGWSSQRGTTVVIDGTELGMEEFAALLGTYEGFSFELRIKDMLED